MHPSLARTAEDTPGVGNISLESSGPGRSTGDRGPVGNIATDMNSNADIEEEKRQTLLNETLNACSSGVRRADRGAEGQGTTGSVVRGSAINGDSGADDLSAVAGGAVVSNDGVLGVSAHSGNILDSGTDIRAGGDSRAVYTRTSTTASQAPSEEPPRVARSARRSWQAQSKRRGST
jgi:hypothetical protein